MRVLFRADARHGIGAGHVLRCLAIAQACRDEEAHGSRESLAELLLVSTDLPQALRRRWEAEGARVVDPSREGGATEPEASLRALVRTWRPHVTVLDGYHLDQLTEGALTATGAKLVVLDDNHERDTSRADLVINAGAHAASIDYGPTASLRGLPFALLRRELRHATSAPGPSTDALCAAPVLVTLGGSDPRDLTAPLVERLVARGLPVAALLGDLHARGARLDGACTLPGVERLEAREDIVPLLSRVGWAVSAAGGTALELTALGHPVVALATVPNQRAAAHALPGPSFDLVGLEGAALEHALDAAVDAVIAARRDHTRSRTLAAVGRARIDGQGAVRVAHALASLAARRPAP
jgi:spore coat polysaccharide biosynthesis predicted glycosyltransferase SpsG